MKAAGFQVSMAVMALHVLGVSVLAETNGVLRLSLADAVEMALASSGELAAQRAGGQIADGIRQAADGLARPTLQTRLSHRRSEGGGGSGESVARLAARMPLYQGGLVEAERGRAAQYEELVRARIALARRTVARDVRLAYCRVLLAEELERVSATQTQIARQFLKSTRERLDRNLVSQREVLRAEVELANQEADLMQARDNLLVQRVELRRVLGALGRGEIRLLDRLEHLSDVLVVPDAPTAGLADRRPEVEVARQQVAARAHTVRALRSEKRPQVNVEGAFESETDWGGYDEDDWQVALTVDLPFFDAWQVGGQVLQEEARRYQDEQRRRDVVRDVRAAIERARVRLENAAARAAHLAATVGKAESFLVGERDRLAVGSATYLDVLNARRALAQSQREYHRALFDVAAARVELMVE